MNFTQKNKLKIEKKNQLPGTSHGSFDHIWTVCSYITLPDMLTTLRVSLQIDGSSLAQLTGMHVSMDVSRRKRHQGLQRNVSDLHTITCHWCCCMTWGRKWAAWPCKAVVPVWIVTQSPVCSSIQTPIHTGNHLFSKLFTIIFSQLVDSFLQSVKFITLTYSLTL